MSVPHEALTSLQEQLTLDDRQLAIIGIARSIAATEKEITSAEHSITFNRSYTPTYPGPRPHPEAGGMDHQDWEAAAYEYAHAEEDTEEAISYAEGKLQDAEDKLSGLRSDKQAVQDGDDKVASKYAIAERERIQVEIEKQRAKQAEDSRWEIANTGTEIEGSAHLAATLKLLTNMERLEAAKGRVSAEGWAYIGEDELRFNKKLFYRNAFSGPFNVFTERLTIGPSVGPIYNSKRRITYLRLPEDTNVSDEYAKGRTTQKPAEYYSFFIDEAGVVSLQHHAYGPVTQGPDSYGTGGNNYYAGSTFHIKTELMEKAYDNAASPDARMNADDIAKLQAVADQVAKAVR